MQTSRVGRPKSAEKRKAILTAATELFLANGVQQTSMAEVAKHSGVSKQTIYSHYQNKDALFSAVIAFKCEEYMIKTEDLASNESDLKTALTSIANKFVALFHDEVVIAMHATMISEASNAPDVVKIFHEAGPLASIKALSEVFQEMSKRALSEADARMLSLDFYTFLKGDWHNQSLLNLEFRLNDQQRETHVKAVVDKTMCLLEHYYQ